MEISFADRDFEKLANNDKKLVREYGKGQWGCDLIQLYRLVFTPQEDPIPANEHGQYIWLEITGVEIIEVINYQKEK